MSLRLNCEFNVNINVNYIFMLYKLYKHYIYEDHLLSECNIHICTMMWVENTVDFQSYQQYIVKINKINRKK